MVMEKSYFVKSVGTLIRTAENLYRMQEIRNNRINHCKVEKPA